MPMDRNRNSVSRNTAGAFTAANAERRRGVTNGSLCDPLRSLRSISRLMLSKHQTRSTQDDT